jgi:hypothetical protein
MTARVARDDRPRADASISNIVAADALHLERKLRWCRAEQARLTLLVKIRALDASETDARIAGLQDEERDLEIALAETRASSP